MLQANTVLQHLLFEHSSCCVWHLLVVLQAMYNSMTLPAGRCMPSERIIELAVIGSHSGRVYSSLVNSEGVRVSLYFPHACGPT